MCIYITLCTVVIDYVTVTQFSHVTFAMIACIYFKPFRNVQSAITGYILLASYVAN